jgi:hypothetical protein
MPMHSNTTPSALATHKESTPLATSGKSNEYHQTSKMKQYMKLIE